MNIARGCKSALCLPLILSLAAMISLYSCGDLQSKYIKQDKLFRTAHAEDCRASDKWLIDKALLADTDPEIRTRAALAVGRIGGDYYKSDLLSNLRDTSAAAAEAKFFAAGLIGDSAFVGPLLDLARGDGPAREAAVEALGRVADSTLAGELSGFLDDPDSLVVYQAILALWRSGGWSQAEKIARTGLATDNRQIKWGAVYALSRGRRSEGRPLFRALIADVDPEFRMQAYAGLGRSADTASLDLIATGLNDADARVVAGAIFALSGFGETGVKYIGKKLTELEDEKLLTLAIDIIGNTPYAKAQKTIWMIFDGDSRENVRASAAAALLKIGGIETLAHVEQILSQPTVYQKVKIAEGLAAVDQKAAAVKLGQLLTEPAPLVRATALESLCAVDSTSAPQYIADALHDSDYVVSATAVYLAAGGGLTELIPDIAGLYLADRAGLADDLKRSIIEVWGQYLADSAYDHGHDSLIMATLEEACNDEWLVIRNEAANVLNEYFDIDRRHLVGAARSKIEKRNYRDLFDRFENNPTATINTSRGTIVIELFQNQAPMTVNNFISLAEKKFYDDKIFHRVVPNFVIQDGCPRGDGWGGPGYAVRCEYSRITYAAGMVGMAHSGKDTGGSQYFITLSPQPHLDGRYTVFGRVISGMDVAQDIVRGDGITEVTIQYDRGDR